MPLLLPASGVKAKNVETKALGTEPVLGITPPIVRKELQHWACREQWRQWHEATKFHRAKQLLRQVNKFF